MVKVNARSNQLARTNRKAQFNKAPSLHSNHIKALMNGLPHRNLIYVGDVQVAKEKALANRREQSNKVALIPGTYDGLIVRSNIVDLSHQKGNYFNILKQFPHAEVLILSHTLTTGLNMVRANKTLKTLMAGFSKINNIRVTEGLKFLETLDISYTPTTYLDPLEGSRTLKYLLIAGSNVQDISAAFGIKTLKALVIHEKQIPALQLREFRIAVPHCNIIINKLDRTAKKNMLSKEPMYNDPQKMIMPWQEDYFEHYKEFGVD